MKNRRPQEKSCLSVVINFLSSCKPSKLILGYLCFSGLFLKCETKKQDGYFLPVDDDLPVPEYKLLSNGRYKSCISMNMSNPINIIREGLPHFFKVSRTKSEGTICFTTDKNLNANLEAEVYWKKCEELTGVITPRRVGDLDIQNVTTSHDDVEEDLVKCEVKYCDSEGPYWEHYGRRRC